MAFVHPLFFFFSFSPITLFIWFFFHVLLPLTMSRDALIFDSKPSKTITTCRSSSVRIAIASSQERSIYPAISARTPKKNRSSVRSVAGRLSESKDPFYQIVALSTSLTRARDSLIRHTKSHTNSGAGRRRKVSEILTDLRGSAITRNVQDYSGLSPPGSAGRNSASCTNPNPARVSASQFWGGQG